MHTLHLYNHGTGFRWRFKARNGRILAHSGESYHRRRDMIKAIMILFPHFYDGDAKCLRGPGHETYRVRDTTRKETR